MKKLLKLSQEQGRRQSNSKFIIYKTTFVIVGGIVALICFIFCGVPLAIYYKDLGFGIFVSGLSLAGLIFVLWYAEKAEKGIFGESEENENV